jgi:hypothetical protein
MFMKIKLVSQIPCCRIGFPWQGGITSPHDGATPPLRTPPLIRSSTTERLYENRKL